MAEQCTLVPHLVVKGASKAIEFYKAGLGATEMSRSPSPDGRLMHAALRIGAAMVFLCDDFPEYCGGISRAPAGPTPVTLHLIVADCDAAMAKAAAAGATITMPAGDMFWGDRYGKLTDPFGHEWSFSTPLSPDRKAAAEKKWAEENPFAAKK
jgi:PhnB protein